MIRYIDVHFIQLGAEMTVTDTNSEHSDDNFEGVGEADFLDVVSEIAGNGAELILESDGKHKRRSGYDTAIDFLLRYLPDRSRASTLYEAYDEHFGWSKLFKLTWWQIADLLRSYKVLDHFPGYHENGHYWLKQ